MVKLDGRTICLIGGLAAVPRQVAIDEVERRGGVLRRGLTGRTDLAVVGRGARSLLPGGRLFAILERADDWRITCVSENTFLRALGLLAPFKVDEASLPLADLIRGSRLDPAVARLLRLFDLIEVEDDRCSFRDTVTAREVARLLTEGVSLSEILDGVGRISRRDVHDHPLARHKLLCDGDGRLVVRCGDGLAELDGQMRLALPEAEGASIDFLFEAAEEAEQDGDLVTAEELYRRCVDLDRRDPIAAFNLANVLHQQGRPQDAKWYLQLALTIDPTFSEAWYNLANILHAEGRRELARDYWMRAVAADPEYSDPIYNLAHGHFEAGALAEAAEWWQRYLALDPDSEWSRKARRGLALCQQHLQEVERHLHEVE